VSVVANVAINVDSRNAVGKLREVQAQSKQTERAFGGIAAAATKLATAFGAIQAARFVFAKTAELESQSRSLAILAGSAQKAGQIIKELQDLGAVTPFTSTELIDSAKRLQAFGVEADKVVETTRRLADASGATGAELSGLVTAYGQVQAKGRLQGEELLQFQERGIALQEELRKMYGMTGEEFQKALSKGQVSAKAVEVALANLTSTGGKYANGAIAQSDTLNGRLSTLQDNVDALARRIGQVLTPALKAIFNQAIAVVDAINAALAAGRGGAFTRNVAGAKQFLNIGATSQAVDNIAKGVGQVSSQKNKSGIQQNLQALQQYQRLLQSISADDPNADRAVQLQGEILTKINQNLAAQKQLQSGAKQVDKLFTPPLLGAPPAGGGGGGGAKKGNDDAERAAEQMQQQLKAADDINFALKNRLAITQETEAVAKRMIEFDVRQNEIAKEYDELKKAAKSADELALINANLVIEQRIAQIEAEQQINDLLAERALLMADVMRQAAMPAVYNELEEQDAALQAVLDKYPAIGAAADAAATLATSGISEMIAGTKSAEQVFVEFLSSIADALINTAKQMIAQYIAIGIARMFAGMGGGGGGGFAPSGPLAAVGNINPMPTSFTPFAEGGFVTGPTNAIIGEGGESEYVIPASKMSAAMSRYSRGARGEGVIAGSGGDTSEAGGNATPVNGAIDVRYTVERINSVEYVTADQFQRGMQQAAMQGAQRGEQQALRQLQQNTAVRGRVGLR
jgi:tape measure domain-containing protein